MQLIWSLLTSLFLPLTTTIKHLKIAIIKRAEESKNCPFVLEGKQSLGSCLRIRVSSENAIDLSNCSIQWYRAACETSRREAISGTELVLTISFWFLKNESLAYAVDVFALKVPTDLYMLLNHLMLGGSYRQTFFQMDKKSQLQPMVQLILVSITKPIDDIDILSGQ